MVCRAVIFLDENFECEYIQAESSHQKHLSGVQIVKLLHCAARLFEMKGASWCAGNEKATEPPDPCYLGSLSHPMFEFPSHLWLGRDDPQRIPSSTDLPSGRRGH